MATTSSLIAALASRRLVTVSGPDAAGFLQGLMTVDIRKLAAKQLVAGAFLNAKGRILYDVLMVKRESGDGAVSFDLETSKSSANDLAGMLMRYKLRKKVSVAVDETRSVLAVWKGDVEGEMFPDPRPGHALGKRVWTSKQGSVPADKLLDEAVYHQIRIASGIAEGPEECADELPFVLNFDWWPNALSFDKGCYTGQELIARTHFKGQVRKRVVPVILSTASSSSTSSSPASDSLLPSWATSWKIDKSSQSVPPLKSVIEPIPGTPSKVADGTLLALAPGKMSHLGLAAFREAQAVSPPGNSFAPTHQIKTEQGDVIQVCPIRPPWWPAVESI